MAQVGAIVEWLVAQWMARFSEITLTMGDLQPDMYVAHIEDSQIKGGLLWWEQPFSCAPDSPVWVGAPEDAWDEVGRVVLAAAGVDPAPASEIQSTYLEIVRQSMGSLGNDIGDRMGTQVTATKGAETVPRKISRHPFRIEAKLADKTVEFYLIIATDLGHIIGAAERDNEAASASHKQLQTQNDASEASALPSSRTFELLLDVELPICVSFGRAALKLQDAIKLITGSLIELDRGLSDPVDLLVNNCVIARGEVVVVEGNYGVRITEIVSQKERLQQTRRYMLQ